MVVEEAGTALLTPWIPSTRRKISAATPRRMATIEKIRTTVTVRKVSELRLKKPARNSMVSVKAAVDRAKGGRGRQTTCIWRPAPRETECSNGTEMSSETTCKEGSLGSREESRMSAF